MRFIKLTQGKVAIVDDADFECLNQFKWYALKGMRIYYAARRTPLAEVGGFKRMHILMHRVIMNVPKDREIDHRNHNGLDNRRCNLRICTKQQNGANRRIQVRQKTSKWKGISWYKQTGKWSSRIKCDGKSIYLGYYHNEIEAALVYDRKAIELYGEFACLNFPTKQKTKTA